MGTSTRLLSGSRYFLARSVVKDGKVEDRTSSLKLKRSLCVRKTGIRHFFCANEIPKPYVAH